jgi:hypothetical protein
MGPHFRTSALQNFKIGFLKRFSEIVGKISEARIYIHAFNHNNKLFKHRKSYQCTALAKNTFKIDNDSSVPLYK